MRHGVAPLAVAACPGCLMFRAPIAVRILIGRPRTTGRSWVLVARSVVGHRWREGGEAERERSRYKRNCDFN